MHLPRTCWVFLLCAALTACSDGLRDADGDDVADVEDCAPGDGTRWQLFRFQSLDADGDGHYVNSSGQVCSGTSLPATHSLATVQAGAEDCNDANESRWQLLDYVSVDADLDGFSIASVGQACSGPSLPPGFGLVVPATALVDCDDTRATEWRFATIFADADGDGIGAGAGTPTCIGTAPSAGSSMYGYDPLDDPGDPDAPTVSNFDLPSWLLTVP
jgi:hypothetical protein